MVCAGVLTASLTSAGISGAVDGSPRLGDPYIDLGRGPVWIHEPSAYDPNISWPLVLLLHGYGNTGDEQEFYMQFGPLIDEYGFFYLHPDGTEDEIGFQFWNATDSCCNFFGSGVDDSGYLLALVDEMKSLYNIDDRRVYFIGHSNGGFMSYRMACDHPETVAAIASLAGATFYDPDDCTPAAPVHVLQIHGTADNVILYGGGELFGVPYPGAVQTVETWAMNDGCELVFETLPPLDLDASIPGDETTVTQYATECEPGGSAELWTIAGGSHSPVLSENFSTLVIEFLLAHPKPGGCPADFDGDGDVDTSDLLFLLAAWGTPDGDVDGDGDTDTSDLLALLAAWGECP
jgi:polyhydroxybutyrate depolymerase